MKQSYLIAVVGLIFAAAFSRFIPHPPNFTALTAIALFGGSVFQRKWMAFLVVFSAMFLTDLVYGLHDTLPFVYGAFALVILLGGILKGNNLSIKTPVLLGTSSLLFFSISNFGVWIQGGLYPKTLEGLMACYVAAIPFLQNQLLGDAFFGVLLFGGYELIARVIGQGAQVKLQGIKNSKQF